MRVDWLIIGAGYSACVLAERIASQLSHRVLIRHGSGSTAGPKPI